ncbi:MULTISPECIES: EAL domain-containing protein [Sutcliffiella]|uniref:Diguanylate phosphodiesterase n=1 Tax=Sutcliffiella cohnii TaxID=33932 RepID=A0A223KNE8_9BACI|nr:MULTISPECIES: EAL domain-containing protein [Sutcliffiella]AST91035.1 diguanylate phosphodiesterase [Sutcliffiella cohnii]WBL16837.1 EAL domain-containing protein [Sutcliffiella sp. NC1]
MGCQSCVIGEIYFEVKMEGQYNSKILERITSYLENHHSSIDQNNNTWKIKETVLKELFDFSKDMMDQRDIYFRIESEQNWKSFHEAEAIFEQQWIDDVIKNELITFFFQPIITAKKEIFAYEMLARFRDEEGKIVSPSNIFRAAKERGRLYALDRVCRLNAIKASRAVDEKVFINFIPTSIYSPEYCLKSTVNLANSLGLNPSKFVFEVVETEKVDDIDHLKSILTFYKEKGFQYALDDVGEGYSTINLLADLKPHYMKLDLKYVQGVAETVEKQRVAEKFLKKALEIGSIPLAEGIENKEDFEWLKDIGYQLFQGYYFGKPSPKPLKYV